MLGAYGFGYKSGPQGHALSAQLGWVELGDDVEIGANATIDRGTYGPTVIGSGTKVDNLVMIGHNCELGRHNVFASQVGLAGSCSTGDFVRLAGQVGVAEGSYAVLFGLFGLSVQAGVAVSFVRRLRSIVTAGLGCCASASCASSPASGVRKACAAWAVKACSLTTRCANRRPNCSMACVIVANSCRSALGR